MLDLCAGRLGIARVFADRGHEVVAVDLVAPPCIPDGVIFVKADILKIYFGSDGLTVHRPDNVRNEVLGRFDFVWASTPCQEFSVHGLKCFHPNPPYPSMGLKLFNHAREILESAGVSYCMENVRSAQAFVGNAVHHCGPFYLWGNSVPPLLHKGITKGTKFGLDKDGTRTTRKTHDMYYRTGSKSKSRRDHTANVATIPLELASCVCDYAERILEAKR